MTPPKVLSSKVEENLDWLSSTIVGNDIPAQISDVATWLDCTYDTARKYVQILVDRGVVVSSPMTRRRVLYHAPDSLAAVDVLSADVKPLWRDIRSVLSEMSEGATLSYVVDRTGRNRCKVREELVRRTASGDVRRSLEKVTATTGASRRHRYWLTGD